MGQSGEYNSLGQILAEGAEQALGLAIFHHYPSERIEGIIARRFGPIAPDDRAVLERLARDGVNAGERLTEQIRQQNRPSSGSGFTQSFGAEGEDLPGRISPDQLPTNPYLYGDDPDGRRVRVIGVIEFPDSGAVIRTYVDFEDMPSVEEMIDALNERGRGIGEKYPRKFGLDPNMPVNTVVLETAFAEKRF